MFCAKNLIIKGLQRKGAQEFDSRGVTPDFAPSMILRRRFGDCGGDPSIHAGRCIAHKWLLVKYLCESVEVPDTVDFTHR
jgi:hypothetical protein